MFLFLWVSIFLKRHHGNGKDISVYIDPREGNNRAIKPNDDTECWSEIALTYDGTQLTGRLKQVYLGVCEDYFLHCVFHHIPMN